MKKIFSTLFISFVLIFFLFSNASAGKNDHYVKIINKASYPIIEFSRAPHYYTEKGGLLLPRGESIAPNTTRVFKVDEGRADCHYDFYVRFLHDNKNREYYYSTVRGFNICTLDHWLITDNQISYGKY